VAEVAVLKVLFEHLYTSINGVGNQGAKASIPVRRDWAAEMLAGSVTFCDLL
jgi:hypothetical protein